MQLESGVGTDLLIAVFGAKISLGHGAFARHGKSERRMYWRCCLDGKSSEELLLIALPASSKCCPRLP